MGILSWLQGESSLVRDRYEIIGPPMSIKNARGFGKFLGIYEIHINGLKVEHFQDGEWHEDKPLQTTVMVAAGEASAGIVSAGVVAPVAAPILAPVLIPLAPILVPLSIPVLIGTIITQITSKFAAHAIMVRNPGIANAKGYPEKTRISFQFSDVTNRRIDWAESLISMWAVANNKEIQGLKKERNLEYAIGYVQKYGRYPIPWNKKKTPKIKQKRQ